MPLYILLTVAAFMLSFYLWKKIKKHSYIKTIWNALDRDAGMPRHYANFKYDYTDELKIVSTVSVPQSVIQVVKEGISHAIQCIKYHKPDWTEALELKDFVVAFVDPPIDGSGKRLTNMNPLGSPALYVFGIQSAGTVVGARPDHQWTKPPVVVLPHQDAQGWAYMDYLHNSARNEAEHRVEFANDINTFLSFTGANDVHPHWSDPV